MSQSSSYYAAGDVLVVDSGNNAIRRVSGDDVSTLITGLAFAPTAMAYSTRATGAIYFSRIVAESCVQDSVRVWGGVNRTRAVKRSSGLVDNVTPSSARFNAPEGLALDGANRILYVADTGKHTPLGRSTLSTGAGDDSTRAMGRFSASGAVLDSDGILFHPSTLQLPGGDRV